MCHPANSTKRSYLLGHLLLGDDVPQVVEGDEPACLLISLLRLDRQVSNVAKRTEGLSSEAHGLHGVYVLKVSDL